jgi:WhiB family transcriptional regulator, redox-sensing transcriptional regulator
MPPLSQQAQERQTAQLAEFHERHDAAAEALRAQWALDDADKQARIQATLALAGEIAGTVAVKQLSWRQRAACRGLSSDIFYPISENETDIAKSICATCPVAGACLEFALGNREREGVWGGTSERERRRIVRQRRKAQASGLL